MTPNKEDYLKCIYEIGSRHKKITNKEIAQLMQVSPPAVTEKNAGGRTSGQG